MEKKDSHIASVLKTEFKKLERRLLDKIGRRLLENHSTSSRQTKAILIVRYEGDFIAVTAVKNKALQKYCFKKDGIDAQLLLELVRNRRVDIRDLDLNEKVTMESVRKRLLRGIRDKLWPIIGFQWIESERRTLESKGTSSNLCYRLHNGIIIKNKLPLNHNQSVPN